MAWISLKRKQWIWISLVCFACSLTVSSGFALDVKQVPNPRQIEGNWVTDMAELLKPDTIAQLNQMITSLEAQNGDEIAVVTVPETEPAASPKEFATALFNEWHIGKKDQNNGVLLLISKGDRRVEIETGYGVEAILPDAKVGQIISSEITPRFKAGDYDGGTLAGTKSLVQALSGVNEAPAPPTPASPILAGFWTVVWIAVSLLAYWGIQSSRRQLIAIDRSEGTPLEPNGRFDLTPDKAWKRNFDRSFVWCRDRMGPFLLIGFSAAVLLCGLVSLCVQASVLLFGLEQSLAYTITFIFCGITLFCWLLSGLSTAFSLNRKAEERFKQRMKTGYFRCQTCQSLLEKLDDSQISTALTPAEQTARSLGTLTIEGWRCKKCQPNLPAPGLRLELSRPLQSEFEVCPTCKEQTVKANLIVVRTEPTWHRDGAGSVISECQCCHLRQEIEQPLARLAPAHTLFLEPGGRSRSTSGSDVEAYCAECGGRLQQEAVTLDPLPLNKASIPAKPLPGFTKRLSKAEVTAIRLGSLGCVSWQCQHCAQDPHLRLYAFQTPQSSASSGTLCGCPTCGEVTAIRSAKLIRAATPKQNGLSKITIQCQCCSYNRVTDNTIVHPQAMTKNRSVSQDDTTSDPGTSASDSSWSSSSDSSSWSSSSDSSSWSSDSGSSWSSSSDSGSSWGSDSGSSWGGSDFGGGSSGGGGAGHSW